MRNHNEFVQLIDRYRLGQAQRLSIGLALASDYRSLQSSLVLAEGRGKFLRPRWIESRKTRLPESIGNACQKAFNHKVWNVGEFVETRIDLTRFIATAVNELAAFSGSHSNLLFVVCVDEPGIWIPDYDNNMIWQPLCESEALAESCGLTVVDALPGRDLAAGGRGWPIGPLPHWLMFADRNRTIADKPRLLVDFGHFTELTWLPESDGLDDDLPAIRYARLLGANFEGRLVQVCGQPATDFARRNEIGAQGKVNQEILSVWDEFENQQELSKCTPGDDVMNGLVNRCIQVIRKLDLSLADVLISFSSHIARSINHFVSKRSSHNNYQFVAGGDLGNHGLLLSEINRRLEAQWFDGGPINYDGAFLPSTSAAITGLMHVDQMPVTIPWITGSDHSRMLGRLTPGNPANWRRVIMEMGDCRPPVMKLREAV